MKNPRSIKRMLVTVFIVVLVIFLALVVIFGDNKKESDPDYTTYSANPNGVKAIYLLSNEVGYSVERYERPSRFLQDNAVLILVKPDMTRIDDIEVSYLEKWIKKGNLLLIYDDASKFDDYSLEGFKESKEIKNDQKDYRSFNVGKGQIIYDTDVQGITNNGLKKLQHGVDFISILDEKGINTVLFNEYYHGYGAQGVSITDLLGLSGELVILQIVLGIVVLILIFGRRFGKPAVVFEIIKRMENENLFALSNIYRKSKANTHVLQIHFDRVKKELSRFLGSNTVISDIELIKSASKYKFLNELNIKEVIDSCNYYTNLGKLSTKKLQAIIAKLEEVRKGIR